MSKHKCSSCGDRNAPVFLYVKDCALVIAGRPDKPPKDAPFVYYFCKEIECLREWLIKNVEQPADQYNTNRSKISLYH